ncbi:MAG: hypothetical protein OEZ42_07985, partial [Gemmatimonadota bacterium]|nr:hypothetical protein [Gemmatimonadota bacterium]
MRAIFSGSRNPVRYPLIALWEFSSPKIWFSYCLRASGLAAASVHHRKLPLDARELRGVLHVAQILHLGHREQSASGAGVPGHEHE